MKRQWIVYTTCLVVLAVLSPAIAAVVACAIAVDEIRNRR